MCCLRLLESRKFASDRFFFSAMRFEFSVDSWLSLSVIRNVFPQLIPGLTLYSYFSHFLSLILGLILLFRLFSVG